MTWIGGPEHRFQPTLWTVVRRATGEPGPAAHEAMQSLIERYWKPVYHFIRRRGADPEQAKDLTQAFFCQVIEKRALGQADPARGRFRTYLLGCLQFFLSNQRQAARAARRGGGRAPLPLDFPGAEAAYGLWDRGPTPEQLYLRAWARDLIDQALERLRQGLAEQGKQVYYEALRLSLLPERPSYEQIAQRLGVRTTDVTNYLHRARRRFRECLLELVLPTVSDPAEAADEIGALLDALE